MSSFADWLTRVLEQGESIQSSKPIPPPRSVLDPILEPAFRRHSLDIAGPPIDYDASVAQSAAITLAQACWMLVSTEPVSTLPVSHLTFPSTPAHHMSADVTLRLLPAVYRRLRPRGEADAQTKWVADLLTHWPLSGVGAGLTAPPRSLVFDHPGLELLYAERFLETPTGPWLPVEGSLRDQIERVFAEHNKPLPLVPAKQESA